MMTPPSANSCRFGRRHRDLRPRQITDLWTKHRDWVFEPIHYSSLDALVAALDEEIIKPAEVRFDELVTRKAEKIRGRHV
jgi:hypothetical protein